MHTGAQIEIRGNKTKTKQNKTKASGDKDKLQGRQQDRWKLTSSGIEFHAAAGAGRPPIP